MSTLAPSGPTPEEHEALDRELRAIEGVLSVGVREDDGCTLVQVALGAESVAAAIRDHIRRVAKAHTGRPLVLEIVVDQSSRLGTA